MKLASGLAASLLIMCTVPAQARDPLASYLTSVARRCEKAYYPPGDLYGTACSVRFTIDRKGRALDLQLVDVPSYSGTDRQDAFAVNQIQDALIHASKFRSLPKKLGDRIVVDVKFDTKITHQIIVTASAQANGNRASGSYSN